VRIKPIGSTSAGNAYVLEANNKRYLIEAGLTWNNLQKGFDFKLPDVVLCSHSHKDHSANIIKLAVKGIPVVCSHETAKEIGLLNWQIDLPSRWSTRLYKGTHDVPVSLFLIDDKETGERLLFATDTENIPLKVDGITHLMLEINHSTYTEDEDSHQIDRARQTHLSLEVALEWIEAMDKSKLKEVHILHLSSDNSDEEFFKTEIEKATGVVVVVH
jgi:phosphoribosyl 1,2-cyclic phosphodiesterase